MIGTDQREDESESPKVQQSDTRKKVDSLEEWARIISILDNEIWSDDISPEFLIRHHSERWSDELLEKIIGDRNINFDCVKEKLSNLLSFNLDEKLKKLLKFPKNNKIITLNEFFNNVLEGAIEYSCREETMDYWESKKKFSAGAIYIYDDEYDELVMTASQGFPLIYKHENNALKEIEKDLSDLNQSKNNNKHEIVCRLAENLGYNMDEILNAIQDKSSTFKTSIYDLAKIIDEYIRKKHIDDKIMVYNHAQMAINFVSNLGRLQYIQKKLHQQVANKLMQREPWLREELRGWYAFNPDDSENVNLDCNRLLVGIAYYKPGSGITGQLFDKDKGPELERIQMMEANLKSEINAKLQNLPNELKKYLIDELLYRRTIVYEKRDEMAAGRQVKAGTYEGLQFPDSTFIGPFLGTVLRFNGEHFGILKVERHKFDNGKASSDKFNLWQCPKEDVSQYNSGEIRNFLLFSYILSGILYVLKYHFGEDLREGWTSLDLFDHKGTRESY